jgi:hypothetical protein
MRNRSNCKVGSSTRFAFKARAMLSARGRSGTPQGAQRATGGAEQAGRRPRLGGPKEYKRSTRSPGGGALRRSAGMRPNSSRTKHEENLHLQKDGLGKRLRMYQ